MKPTDLVYDQIYKGSLRAGATERASLDAATTGLDSYKKGKYKKVTDLITNKIKEAKRRK